uniref:Uncharacterized protein n=1 Tax=Anguilla anguilla TaxID=7936 RepID=A0A0E9RHQ0_ANGAN
MQICLRRCFFTLSRTLVWSLGSGLLSDFHSPCTKHACA